MTPTPATTTEIIQGDCLDLMTAMPDNCVDLVITSPPYGRARWYGALKFKLTGQEYVDWCVDRFLECLRVTDGPVCWVIQGRTERFKWDATPCLLVADLHRRGVNLRCPKIFHRVGIPGSGGPDWFRNDWEMIVCATPPGKLKWSDNTACGHPPKWAPGGEMSNRLSNGARVNQWGHSIDTGATVVEPGGVVRSKGKRPSHRPGVAETKIPGGGTALTILERPGDKPWGEGGFLPGTKNGDVVRRKRKIITVPRPGMHNQDQSYNEPVLANPGNLIEQTYTAEAVAELIERSESGLDLPDVLDLIVGGGVMGSKLCHENEAPFPESLAERFIRSLCPPGGKVLDPFGGSGTVLAVAKRWGRNAIGMDLREDQCALMRRRVEEVEKELAAAAGK